MVINFRRMPSNHFPLNIDGSSVKIVNSTKFLGVHLEENLTCSAQTNAPPYTVTADTSSYKQGDTITELQSSNEETLRRSSRVQPSVNQATNASPKGFPEDFISTKAHQPISNAVIIFAGGEPTDEAQHDTMTLSGPSEGFKGFLLEARPVGGNSLVGTFSLMGSASQLLKCGGVSNSAVSHTSSTSKTQIQSKWTAPTSGNLGNIEFRATFVRDKSTFWVAVKSSQITYSGTSTGATSNTSTSPSPSSSISSLNCGISKTCVSQPSGCDPSTSSNCFFMSATPLSSGSGFTFELSGKADGYVSLGFSDDTQMGNVTVLNTSQINGVISCSFTSLNAISTTRSSTPSNSYYIFLASGATSNAFTKPILVKAGGSALIASLGARLNGRRLPKFTPRQRGRGRKGSRCRKISSEPTTGLIQKHASTPVISSTKVDISSVQIVTSDSGIPPIVKAHGCLMLIAWMTTGSMGMLIARFLKRAAPGQRLCGKDFWFVAHVVLMLLSVVATIIAFILIFSYAQDWSGGAHPVLGCLVMILSLAQPIGAVFRCAPQDERRFIFNWIHALNALAIKGLAVAAIFTGLMLADSSPTQWMPKVMGGFVAWEALLFLCQDLYYRCREKDMDKSNGVGTGVLLLFLFFLGNLAFLVALLVGIGTA
ncbi:putative ferric-chelate reductase 1 [Clarias gariepinus]